MVFAVSFISCPYLFKYMPIHTQKLLIYLHFPIIICVSAVYIFFTILYMHIMLMFYRNMFCISNPQFICFFIFVVYFL